MENILTNSGLIHIREKIFDHFDHKTLKICREVFAKKYGEDWDLWLEKRILFHRLLEIGDKKTRNPQCFDLTRIVLIKNLIPGWDKAVKQFVIVKIASLNDLNEVKESLKGLSYGCYINYEFKYGWYENSNFWDGLLHHAACKGHVKLMELLFYTGLKINKEHSWYLESAFSVACNYDQQEIVNLMVTSSKEYGIDLNVRDRSGRTGFMGACQRGHLRIVKLLIENRAKYGINIQTKDNSGRTALDLVNLVNEEIESELSIRGRRISENRKASYKELKRILEKAYLEDNDPQPTV